MTPQPTDDLMEIAGRLRASLEKFYWLRRKGLKMTHTPACAKYYCLGATCTCGADDAARAMTDFDRFVKERETND